MARRFQFRLKTLLKVRQLREREAKRRVAAKRSEIARVDQLRRQTSAELTRQQEALLGEQLQGHLDTLIEEMEFQIDSSPELTRSIVVTKYGNPKIYRKPYFRLEFTNGAILYFRPAGAYGDAFILNAALMLDFVWSLSSSGRWSHTFLTLSLRHRCNGFSERYTESMAFFRAFDPSITNSRFTPGVTPRLAMFSRNAVGSHVLWIVANLDNNSITKKHTLCPIAKY